MQEALQEFYDNEISELTTKEWALRKNHPRYPLKPNQRCFLLYQIKDAFSCRSLKRALLDNIGTAHLPNFKGWLDTVKIFYWKFLPSCHLYMSII
uniref:Uncharacterized protein n=1 Tax=Romanomermis culicivorax TaxID=13658 RepID=A0A915I4N1_ROMCU